VVGQLPRLDAALSEATGWAQVNLDDSAAHLPRAVIGFNRVDARECPHRRGERSGKEYANQDVRLRNHVPMKRPAGDKAQQKGTRQADSPIEGEKIETRKTERHP